MRIKIVVDLEFITFFIVDRFDFFERLDFLILDNLVTDRILYIC